MQLSHDAYESTRLSNPSKKKSQKAAIKKLIDRVAKKEWITQTDFKQVTNIIAQFFEERHWDKELRKNYPLGREAMEGAIEFFLKLDLVMISRATAARIKQVGIGVNFIRLAEGQKEVENMSYSLLWYDNSKR